MERRGTYLFMALLVALIITYFGIQGYRYLSDPFTTTLASRYSAEETMELSGYVVREEQVLAGEESDLLRLSRAEGERVGMGGTIAVVYADQGSLDIQEELDALSARLEQLQYARKLRLGMEVSARLDSQILSVLLQYRQQLASGRLDKAAAQGSQLRSLVLKRDYTNADLGTLEEEIAALEARREELENSASRIVRRITAPSSGLYSAMADGYEAVLTPERIRGMPPSQLAETAPEKISASAAGKLIAGNTWYYIAPMLQEDARAIRSLSGGELKLRFSNGAERDFPVALSSISRPEGGRVAVVFSSSEYLPEMTLLRRQTAQLIYGTAEGLRVPREALRMAPRPKTDTAETTGVYCVVGTEARFKPVKVTYTGGDFLLAEPDVPDGEERLRFRAGDEIIVQAANLYDGKSISAALR